MQTPTISFERPAPVKLRPDEQDAWQQIVRGLQTESPQWIDADSVPELKEARLLGRIAAETVLEERMQQLRDGDFDSVPDVVDPLTTAARAHKARNEHGKDSQEYKDAYFSLTVDCQRLLAEALRKGTWEYFPEITQTYDKETDGYQFMGRQLLDMVRDGVTPVAEQEEQGYRIGEYVEEVTYSSVRRLGWIALRNHLPVRYTADKKPDLRVVTLSECADWAIDAYGRKSKGGFGGYVPENNKMMIRGVRYDTESDNRFQEQLGVPGVHFTDDVMNEAMQILGMVQPGQRLGKAERRGKQMLNVEGKGAIYVLQVLDEVASRRSGKNIFRGEEVPADHVKDYSTIPAEAAARQKNIEHEKHELANYLMMLEENGIDHGAALGLVQRRVDKMLFDKVKHDPEQVAIVFDDATAQTLLQAQQERRAGNEKEALRLERLAEKNAPPTTFCGAGSCGLNEVDPSNPKVSAIMSKLNFQPGDRIVQYTEGTCKACGTKGEVFIVYNDSGTKVNKACGACPATEFGGQQN